MKDYSFLVGWGGWYLGVTVLDVFWFMNCGIAHYQHPAVSIIFIVLNFFEQVR